MGQPWASCFSHEWSNWVHKLDDEIVPSTHIFFIFYSLFLFSSALICVCFPSSWPYSNYYDLLSPLPRIWCTMTPGEIRLEASVTGCEGIALETEVGAAVQPASACYERETILFSEELGLMSVTWDLTLQFPPLWLIADGGPSFYWEWMKVFPAALDSCKYPYGETLWHRCEHCSSQYQDPSN